MRKNNKKMKRKKRILIALISVITLMLLGILIYFNSRNKEKETLAQPMEENINNIEEFQENAIDENIETNEKDNNVANQNINTSTNVSTTNASNNINSKNNTTPYYIKVNYGAQVVTIYGKDANGDYTVPVKAMVCSTGTATPKSGVYSIPSRWTWGALFGNVYGQYCVKITGNILFHSVPYLRKGDHASLEYWEYDKLGTAASAGCVRLKVEDLIWLYNNCTNGTKVEFYSSSDPGPLGKPSAKKISSYPDYLRNWDPTDPNPSNPWKNYKENGNANTDDKKNEIVNDVNLDDSEKNEIANDVNSDDSEKNEIVNDVNSDNSEKNEENNSAKPENTKPENSVKNEITNSIKLE